MGTNLFDADQAKEMIEYILGIDAEYQTGVQAAARGMTQTAIE